MISDTQPVGYKVMLESYGTVQPRTQSVLTAQVGGQIITVDENVRDGGFFEKGDVLVEIDARDYAADVRIAQAALADATSAMAEADARWAEVISGRIRLACPRETSTGVAAAPNSVRR